jgi:hypothetical protein
MSCEATQLELGLNVVGRAIPPAMDECQNLVQDGTQFAGPNLPDGAIINLTRPLPGDPELGASLREKTPALPVPAKHTLNHLPIPSAGHTDIQQPNQLILQWRSD